MEEKQLGIRMYKVIDQVSPVDAPLRTPNPLCGHKGLGFGLPQR
jgi:hypothetical protein